ncbi:MAG: class I tRNA ligase family protein, partial [Actinomycetales bacterium]
VRQATAAFEDYNYARALEITESFFWNFTDDYVELVKERAYSTGAAAQSAQACLHLILETVLHLLAPFLPFTTEEVWSWSHSGSIHHQPWPNAESIAQKAPAEDPIVLREVGVALSLVRKAKSDAKASMRTPVSLATITGPASAVEHLRDCAADLISAGHIQQLELVATSAAQIEATVQVASDSSQP